MRVKPIILKAALQYVLPLQLLFSVFLLLRGHNAPGGGFIAGLFVGGSIALYSFVYDVRKVDRLIGAAPYEILGLGLLLAAGAGLVGVAAGEPYLTVLKWEPVLPIFGKTPLSTMLVFEVGVYLTVVGVSMAVLMVVADIEGRR
jgi:multicomponent Na+:H+ antiporter subunit B